ncbi:MAG: methylmalonyl Co-A mutase-associated GTPase MeaB [Sulfobacillus acidophilus]|uniref:Methylmalonyl Co-A mutase-associated GTPase MeaB n=1 Tax=Sulfobacillus acidophilus TaxID=53633 RepID=A0A2T2WPD8_9FIRM|nr:MAG: methylmalonyl Co-A mutase-associated GTPase MeaB [Sulfobacillus acidophilus]
MTDVDSLAQGIQHQQKRAIARGLSWIERDQQLGKDLVRTLFPLAGHAHVIGITGAPGVGKSTLVNRLALALRSQGQRIGILAVDPSSPFSGGAILGDRIRMQDSVMDEGVFMRSLATRGHLGGLSRATFGAVTLLDAAGFDSVLIETVGAGQSEVEVMQLAHSTVVVQAPGLGDDIQAIKAGILEIGQIFVVNKADHEGADHTVRAIRGMLTLGLEHLDWFPPILKTVAERDEGTDAVIRALQDHRAYLQESGQWARMRADQTTHIIELAVRDWAEEALRAARSDANWDKWHEDVLTGRRDAAHVATEVVRRRLAWD